jgi:hypothetical protein
VVPLVRSLALGGKTPEEEKRIQMHIDWGAIPTMTVKSAIEILRPNPAVRKILQMATKQ